MSVAKALDRVEEVAARGANSYCMQNAPENAGLPDWSVNDRGLQLLPPPQSLEVPHILEQTLLTHQSPKHCSSPVQAVPSAAVPDPTRPKQIGT